MEDNSELPDKEQILPLMLMEIKKDLIKTFTELNSKLEIAEGVTIDTHPFVNGEILEDGRMAFTLNPEVEKQFANYYELIKNEAENKNK